MLIWPAAWPTASRCSRSCCQEQEEAVVADKELLLMAICVLSQWTLEQVLATYRLTEAEDVNYLAQLDRIGIIELRPRQPLPAQAG